MREVKDAIVRELERFHCSDYAFAMGGKHPKIVLRRGTLQRTIVFSGSPSCPFAPKKIARNVSHALKELGYAI